MDLSFTVFLYLALAAWRFANLFCNEDGPFCIFRITRNTADLLCEKYPICEAFGLSVLANCEYCLSVYIGGVLTLLYWQFGDRVLYLAVPFALSTCVILIKYVHQFLRAKAP